METRTIIDLVKVEEQEGIVVYQNEETNLKCFKTFKSGNDFISCADGKSLFVDIAILSPHIVVCELPNKNPEDDENSRYRIYLKDFDKWLINPEVQSGLKNEPQPKLKKDQVKVLYNFFEVLYVNETYLHIACQSGGIENRVYVFKHKKWVSVDYHDLIDKKITSFDSVIQSEVKGRLCLILEKKGTMNPYCVFFLEEGNWLSIPNPPGMKAGECPIFRKVFNNYVVVGLGKITLKPQLLYVFAFVKNAYVPARAREDKIESEEAILGSWYENDLTEDFVFYKFDDWRPPYATSSDRLPLYIIYKTLDWQPHQVLDQNGNLHEQVLNPRVKEGKICFEFKIEKSFGEIKI